MLLAVITLEALYVTLSALGMRVEILGYTTQGWRGGQSRQQWIREGKPAWPGRLADLLHVIVIDADDHVRYPKMSEMLKLLHPELLKENVDGEAIVWAAERLRGRKAQKRQLIVISDGVPVDDSTIFANDANLLPDHLRSVLKSLEDAEDISVNGIGIEYDISEYYKNGWTIMYPSQIFEVIGSIYSKGLSPPQRGEQSVRAPSPP